MSLLRSAVSDARPASSKKSAVNHAATSLASPKKKDTVNTRQASMGQEVPAGNAKHNRKLNDSRVSKAPHSAAQEKHVTKSTLNTTGLVQNSNIDVKSNRRNSIEKRPSSLTPPPSFSLNTNIPTINSAQVSSPINSSINNNGTSHHSSVANEPTSLIHTGHSRLSTKIPEHVKSVRDEITKTTSLAKADLPKLSKSTSIPHSSSSLPDTLKADNAHVDLIRGKTTHNSNSPAELFEMDSILTQHINPSRQHTSEHHTSEHHTSEQNNSVDRKSDDLNSAYNVEPTLTPLTKTEGSQHHGTSNSDNQTNYPSKEVKIESYFEQKILPSEDNFLAKKEQDIESTVEKVIKSTLEAMYSEENLERSERTRKQHKQQHREQEQGNETDRHKQGEEYLQSLVNIQKELLTAANRVESESVKATLSQHQHRDNTNINTSPTSSVNTPPSSTDVRIGQVDVFIANSTQQNQSRSASRRPVFSMANRHFLRRL